MGRLSQSVFMGKFTEYPLSSFAPVLIWSLCFVLKQFCQLLKACLCGTSPVGDTFSQADKAWLACNTSDIASGLQTIDRLRRG